MTLHHQFVDHLESRLQNIERRLAAIETASAETSISAILLRLEGKIDKIMTLQSDIDASVQANTAP